MTLNRVKLGLVSAFKFTEPFTARGKWAYEEYLQKIFTIIPFPIQFITAYCKDFKIL